MVGRLEAYLVGHTNCSDRPNMSISTNLSVTSQWPQYNGQINNISWPTLQICPTDQFFFQSSTSRPFYAPRWRDWSARGIPAIPTGNLSYDRRVHESPSGYGPLWWPRSTIFSLNTSNVFSRHPKSFASQPLIFYLGTLNHRFHL